MQVLLTPFISNAGCLLFSCAMHAALLEKGEAKPAQQGLQSLLRLTKARLRWHRYSVQWCKGRMASWYLSKHKLMLMLPGLSAAFDTHNPELSQKMCDRNGRPSIAILLSNPQTFQSKGKLGNSLAISGRKDLLTSSGACFIE